MISDEVRQAGLAAIAVAAAMLVEDAHEALVGTPTMAGGDGTALVAQLSRLGDDLTAFAAAAAVFVREGAVGPPADA